MAASNSQEFLALVGEMENLKTKFASLDLENQCLLGDLQKVNVEKQQQRGVYAAGSTIRINHCSFTTTKKEYSSTNISEDRTQNSTLKEYFSTNAPFPKQNVFSHQISTITVQYYAK